MFQVSAIGIKGVTSRRNIRIGRDPSIPLLQQLHIQQRRLRGRRRNHCPGHIGRSIPALDGYHGRLQTITRRQTNPWNP